MIRIDESNRTERFWTATVLPALLARQDFQGVSLLLELIADGDRGVAFDEQPGGRRESVPVSKLCADKWSYDNLQLSTELWFARDISNNMEFAVPDVVLRLREKYLIVIEAKFFQRIREAAIAPQLALQRKTVEDIVKTDPSIRYVHHCFLHGGADPISDKVGAHSRITWKDVLKGFRSASASTGPSSDDDYFLKILDCALKKYDKEFPPASDRSDYYVDQANFVDLIGILQHRGAEAFVGLGVGHPKNTAEETLAQLVSAVEEEMSYLRNSAKKGESFEQRPEFLRAPKYKGQSAIEYLFVHSSQGYKVDYANGSGDDKTKNPKWVNGIRFLQVLRQLTEAGRRPRKKR